MPEAVTMKPFTKIVYKEYVEVDEEEGEKLLEPLREIKEVENMLKSPIKAITVKGKASQRQPAILPPAVTPVIG